MEEKIKKYIEDVFREVPKNERSETIKTEIMQNLLDKYHDLRAEGKDEDTAYALAVSTGGDLSGIVSDLKGEAVAYNYNYEKQFDKLYEKQYKKEKKKCARFGGILWPVVVALYFVLNFGFGMWAYSWNIFILGASVASFYRFTVVKSNQKDRKGALSGGIWTLTVVLYFLANFIFGAWSYSWLLFILAIPVTKIAGILAFPEKEDEDEKE